MGSVVALDHFRQSVREKSKKLHIPPRPEISGGEIWGRDYREVEAIVFGLLKVRAMVAHHAEEHDKTFDHFCVEALDAAYHILDVGHARLKASIKPLKEWILDAMTEDNKRDMSWCLVILDLIEKSPVK
ncbi:hypothetical protein [uncultured Pseudodesulfovibrio sp.]|uniref:hypothetical protein n=1 Tax=uncultured Pseudodesulfovibrio sp. TaxID=2035858 RepID=UPI0029C860ED|nr:hypothetical protein [uncultured Pseudodesulfovibrio sp.]